MAQLALRLCPEHGLHSPPKSDIVAGEDIRRIMILLIYNKVLLHENLPGIRVKLRVLRNVQESRHIHHKSSA